MQTVMLLSKLLKLKRRENYVLQKHIDLKLNKKDWHLLKLKKQKVLPLLKLQGKKVLLKLKLKQKLLKHLNYMVKQQLWIWFLICYLSMLKKLPNHLEILTKLQSLILVEEISLVAPEKFLHMQLI